MNEKQNVVSENSESPKSDAALTETQLANENISDAATNQTQAAENNQANTAQNNPIVKSKKAENIGVLVAEFEKKYKELDEQVKRDREEIKRKMDDMDKKS